jgi:hypothetical protein
MQEIRDAVAEAIQDAEALETDEEVIQQGAEDTATMEASAAATIQATQEQSLNTAAPAAQI